MSQEMPGKLMSSLTFVKLKPSHWFMYDGIASITVAKVVWS